MTRARANDPPTPATLRKRRQRSRARNGLVVLTVEIDPRVLVRRGVLGRELLKNRAALPDAIRSLLEVSQYSVGEQLEPR